LPKKQSTLLNVHNDSLDLVEWPLRNWYVFLQDFYNINFFFQGTEREIIESQKLCRRIDEITPALVQAGRIVLNEPNNKVK